MLVLVAANIGYFRTMMQYRFCHWFFFLFIAVQLAACSGHSGKRGVPKDGVFAREDVLKISEAIADAPDKASLYYDRGHLLKKYGEDSLALLDFIQASKLDTTQAVYYSAVGDLMFEHKDISGSVDWLEKALRRNPEDPTARLKVAKLFIYLREYNKAFLEINTVLRKDAYNTEGYFLKGIIRKDIKDTAQAISSFQTVLQIDPTYRDASIQLGLLYSGQKNPLAIKYFDNAFRQDTTDVFPLFAKGMYYQREEALEEAKNVYRECIRRNKGYADAYQNLGYVLIQQDSLETALRQFNIVITLEPDNADAFYNKGLASELSGRKEDAIVSYRKALQLYRNYSDAAEGLKRLGITP